MTSQLQDRRDTGVLSSSRQTAWTLRGKSPFDGAEAREDDFQVLVCGHWVQLADEENILRRPHVCIWEITDLKQTHTQTHTRWETRAVVSRDRAINNRANWSVTISKRIARVFASFSFMISSNSSVSFPSPSLITSSAPIRPLCRATIVLQKTHMSWTHTLQRRLWNVLRFSNERRSCWCSLTGGPGGGVPTLTSSCSLVGSGDRSGTGRPGGSSKGSSRITVWFILQWGEVCLFVQMWGRWWQITDELCLGEPDILERDEVLVNKGFVDFG